MKHYLVGSKYNQGDYYQDIFPDMTKKEAVSVGFAAKYDLTDLYQKDQNKIAQYLQSIGEPRSAISALKRFLNFKPGDLIAVKGSGSPVRKIPRLTIVGYAVVVERNGRIYEHDPHELGHLINVEFFETFLQKEFEIGGYGMTVHELGKKHAEQIFGLYYQVSSYPEVDRKRSGTKQKATERQLRYRTAGYYVVENAHNKLQQKFYDSLVEKYGSNKVTMEEDFVDIKLISDDVITLYEIKRYRTARQCIREALGQLLDYSWFMPSEDTGQIRLVIVGPDRPDAKEKEYISYLKSKLKIDFDYLAFS